MFSIKDADEEVQVLVRMADEIKVFTINSKLELLEQIRQYFSWTGKYSIVYKDETVRKALFDIDENLFQILVRNDYMEKFEDALQTWATAITLEDFLNTDIV